MGLFSSSKSTSLTRVDDTTTTSVDNRATEADTAIVGGNITTGKTGGSVTITATDYGALDAASEIADRSISAVTESAGRALEAVGEAVSNSNTVLERTVSEAVEVAKSAAQDEGARTLRAIVLGLFVVATAFAVRGTIVGRKS